MKLIVIRHAEAIERNADIPDGMRYLTPEGRSLFRKTARTIKAQGIDPEIIMTSPLLRAVQTADILAETLSFRGPLVATDELSPGFDLPSLRAILATNPDAGEIVLVGHEPDLSSVISLILALPQRFSFRKGAAVKVSVTPSGTHETATFKWYACGKKFLKSRQDFLESIVSG